MAPPPPAATTSSPQAAETPSVTTPLKTATTPGAATSPRAATSPQASAAPLAALAAREGDVADLEDGAGADGELQTAEHWRRRPINQDDGDSACGSDLESSTASLSSSILNYRQVNGRSFHSERGDANYWGAHDAAAADSMDMHHHLQLLINNDKLNYAPISKDITKVLDIGTGSGAWAIDMGDEYPGAEIIGTDLSPIQPTWVPPNVKFEIEDCTQSWTFPDNTFDYVHFRYLCGSIADWGHVFREAYRVCKPGGWIESCEWESHKTSDATIKPGTALWDLTLFFVEYGKKIGRTFRPVSEGIQERCMKELCVEALQTFETRVPAGSWPADPRQVEIGRFTQATFCPDIEGYVSLVASELLGWGPDEVTTFCAHVRKEVNDPKKHWAARYKVVWGQKPLNA